MDDLDGNVQNIADAHTAQVAAGRAFQTKLDEARKSSNRAVRTCACPACC